MQIPVEFMPQEVLTYTGALSIKTDKIEWIYPIVGTVDSLSTDQLYSLKTKSRVLLKSSFAFKLPGVQYDPQDQSTFCLCIDKVPRGLEKMVNSSLLIVDSKKQLTAQDVDRISFSLKFHPLRPVKTQVQILIKRSTGGNWRFNVIH